MLNFVKHRAMTMENWVCFTYHNVLECVTMLDENKMKKEVGFFSCWGFNAYNSNKPNSSYVTSHVVLFCDIKMDYQTLKSLRKCMVAPHMVDLQTSFIYFMSIICWVQIHGVGREELFNHFNKEDVEAYFNYSLLQEFSLNWVGAQCFVKGNWTQDKIRGSLTMHH